MRYLLFCFIMLITSCASTVTPIIDGNNTLQPNSGYVLIPVFRNTSIYQINFSGPKSFLFTAENLYYTQSYMLIELPAGKYSFSDMSLNEYTKITEFEPGLWDFTIKPNVINYVGHFVVLNHSKVWTSFQLTYEIQNNSSLALEYLEKEYPQLIQSFPIHYAGPGKDNFFSFIRSLPELDGSK